MSMAVLCSLPAKIAAPFTREENATWNWMANAAPDENPEMVTEFGSTFPLKSPARNEIF
jgi:hypothetical protein